MNNSNNKNESINLLDLFFYLLSKWKWFMIFAIIGLLAAYAWYSSSEFTYFRTATISIKNPQSKTYSASLDRYDNLINNTYTINQIKINPKYYCVMKKYIDYAAKIYEIYLQYIDKNDIHIYSIDESFLDVTDYLKLYKTKAKDFAMKLVNEINEKLHIPSSVGIGTNLYLAKIALDITAKHSTDNIGWLTEEKFKKELWLTRSS